LRSESLRKERTIGDHASPQEGFGLQRDGRRGTITKQETVKVLQYESAAEL
jgi:hypothetical protein